jgi:enoyl-CoA hydratase/carnithine racemase
MIRYERDGALAIITLEGGRDMNLLSADDLAQLGAAWQRFAEDDARVAILTGAGDRAFCAGADVGEIGSLGGDGVEARIEYGYTMKGRPVLKPTIAAVNGHAIGAGLEILLATDIRISVPDATFGLPEVRWGAVPVGGSVARLAQQVPYAWAARLLITGERISSEQALAAGLVTELVDRGALQERAREIAGRMLANSPAATQGIKEALVRAAEPGLRAAHLLETLYADRVAASPDAEEGARAFREQRKPRYAM